MNTISVLYKKNFKFICKKIIYFIYILKLFYSNELNDFNLRLTVIKYFFVISTLDFLTLKDSRVH